MWWKPTLPKFGRLHPRGSIKDRKPNFCDAIGDGNFDDETAREPGSNPDAVQDWLSGRYDEEDFIASGKEGEDYYGEVECVFDDEPGETAVAEDAHPIEDEKLPRRIGSKMVVRSQHPGGELRSEYKGRGEIERASQTWKRVPVRKQYLRH